MDIMIVIQKLIMLLSIMCFGYIARAKNVITNEYNKGFSALIVNVTLPCLIIASMLGSSVQISTSQIVTMLIIMSIIFTILLLIASIIPKIFGADKLQDGIYRFCTLQNNNIFMGFPLIESILGSTGLFFASIYNIPSSLFMFSFGIYYMKRHKSSEKFSISKMLNLGIITTIICTILYFTGVTLHPVLIDTFKSVGNMTVPLSMIVLGSSLATMNVKEIFSDIKIYLFAILKMLVLPIIAFFVLSLFNLDKDIFYVILVSLAMPGPTLCVSLAIEYESDVSLASKYVFLSTIMSIITIPLVIKIIV